ncbi:YceI family protein [Luteolibacter ambystomatis]|uniref:YceI family protein n=1 Tax=Luteolibacter ambystomatis TaxID=2824561 RepID=A0A975G7W9_9BACT|nr:YceI family protein [Luteolibacter ambystomatis]QUE50396.1 YceI family protein [Luteolibacter ambystomatis]
MIAPSALATELASAHPPVVLDVRLADDYEACHIAGALNNAVFEVSFNERFPAQLPDKARPVCIYGASGSSHEAGMAVEKLERAGYTDVAELEGGLEAWLAAGLPNTCGAPLPPAPAVPHGRLLVDLEHSRIGWTGRNLLNHHHGYVPVKSGWLDFVNGRLTGGEIDIDLEHIGCNDLAGTDYHAVLIRHLHDHDFFDVARFPEARLVITSATHLDAGSPGAPNLHVHADLTMKGQTHPIEFAAASGVTAEGQAAAQASFAIDRTRWGVLYGSGKFFHRLAGHLVNDFIEFEVKIVTG